MNLNELINNKELLLSEENIYIEINSIDKINILDDVDFESNIFEIKDIKNMWKYYLEKFNVSEIALNNLKLYIDEKVHNFKFSIKDGILASINFSHNDVLFGNKKIDIVFIFNISYDDQGRHAFSNKQKELIKMYDLEYMMECYLVTEFMDGLKDSGMTIEEKAERTLYYIEHDA